MTAKLPFPSHAGVNADFVGCDVNSLPKITFHPQNMFQSGTVVKSILERDNIIFSDNDLRMKTPREINEEIIKRTAYLRDKSGLKPGEMAKEIGLSVDTYKKYELIYEDRATVLPVYLIPTFCKIVGCSVEYFLTGKENRILKAYYALELDSKEKMAVDQFLGVDSAKKQASN